VAGVILTRNRKEYLAALDKLRKEDLRAAQKAHRARVLAAKKAAAEINRRKEDFRAAQKAHRALVSAAKRISAATNKQHLVDSTSISHEVYLSKKHKKNRRPQVQPKRDIGAYPTKTKATVQSKKFKKKPKKRSVWTVSGGAFESNRRRH
jgi:hypothetical protein